MNSKCEGEDPCEGCRKNLNAKSWGHPCMQSYFLAMVERETCNAVCESPLWVIDRVLQSNRL